MMRTQNVFLKNPTREFFGFEKRKRVCESTLNNFTETLIILLPFPILVPF